MKFIFKSMVVLLLFSTSTYAQRNQIKEALKELKSGNSERAIAILNPVEYLIVNAPLEDRIYFYYVQGTSLLNLANDNIDKTKNIFKATFAFLDLLEVENEAKTNKFTSEALKNLRQIKVDLIASANEDVLSEKFSESSNKFNQAYLIDKKDTLQLYKAAVYYRKANDLDQSLKCFEKLLSINYNDNSYSFIAYNKKLLIDEVFVTEKERDSKIGEGTYMRPARKITSKKGEIYKFMALIYVDKGLKEKALNAIDSAKKYNDIDESLAVIEANLYLANKEYAKFDLLVQNILDTNPRNALLAYNFAVNCEKEMYYQGAQNYYKKAIVIDPLYADAYIELSALLNDRINKIDLKIVSLKPSEVNEKMIQNLKSQKEMLLKSIQPFLQKSVNIDSTNYDVNQLTASSSTNNSKAKAFVSGE